MDQYQQSYLAHQQRKKEVLIQLIEERHSERMFSDKEVDEETLQQLLETRVAAPSSCDRHGVHLSVERERDRKALLGGLLVGGTGWIHRAPLILMLWADPLAYKAGNERDWNTYLDAGFLGEQLFLYATALGLRACFVNPQVRDFNKPHFQQTFGALFGDPEDPAEGIYCGCLAIGWPRNETML
jgi:nitroreductase